jgi:toxin ParE1/3/4
MAALRFTLRAERDLLGISEYTIQTWGERQADRYLRELELCCERLAASPSLGRRCESVRPGLRRFEYAEHVIFYRMEFDGVRVSRILHQRMLPDRHLISGQDDS